MCIRDSFNVDMKFTFQGGTKHVLLDTNIARLLSVIEQIQLSLNSRSLPKNVKKEDIILFNTMAPYLEKCVNIVKKLQELIVR